MARKSGSRKPNQKESQAGKHRDGIDVSVGDGDAAVATDSDQPMVDNGAASAADEQLLRLRADFENYKRRVLREKDELYRRANSDLIAELLPVLDHLEMALQAAGDRGDDPFVQGVRLVGDQLLAALGKFGLSPIQAEGQPFDPNLHEAVSHLPSPDTDENHVMVQTRRGYCLADRLLRAAQVVVSSGSPDTEPMVETE